MADVSAYVFHVGNAILAIPVNALLPIVIILLYFMLFLCMIMSLYNMQLKELNLKQSIVLTFLLFSATSGGWYLWYLVELT